MTDTDDDITPDVDSLAVDHAVGLVLDDETIAVYLLKKTEEKLGRQKPDDDEIDDDEGWWDAYSDQVDQLLDGMKRVNGEGRSVLASVEKNDAQG